MLYCEITKRLTRGEELTLYDTRRNAMVKKTKVLSTLIFSVLKKKKKKCNPTG